MTESHETNIDHTYSILPSLEELKVMETQLLEAQKSHRGKLDRIEEKLSSVRKSIYALNPTPVLPTFEEAATPKAMAMMSKEDFFKQQHEEVDVVRIESVSVEPGPEEEDLEPSPEVDEYFDGNDLSEPVV